MFNISQIYVNWHILSLDMGANRCYNYLFFAGAQSISKLKHSGDRQPQGGVVQPLPFWSKGDNRKKMLKAAFEYNGNVYNVLIQDEDPRTPVFRLGDILVVMPDREDTEFRGATVFFKGQVKMVGPEELKPYGVTPDKLLVATLAT